MYKNLFCLSLFLWISLAIPDRKKEMKIQKDLVQQDLQLTFAIGNSQFLFSSIPYSQRQFGVLVIIVKIGQLYT